MTRVNVYRGNLEDLLLGIESVKHDVAYNSNEILVNVKQARNKIEDFVDYDNVDEKILNDLHDYLDNIEYLVNDIKGGIKNE